MSQINCKQLLKYLIQLLPKNIIELSKQLISNQPINWTNHSFERKCGTVCRQWNGFHN